jgi:SAM-dependent methyltransferase
MGLIQFALDRKIPDWVEADLSKPVIDIGPGTKFNQMADKIVDYPEFNLDGQLSVEVEWTSESGITASGRDPLPFGKDEVGGIFAINVLEHLWDPRHLIDEAARVLAPGCPFTIFVPHPDSVMYKQDLDHKSRFVLDTWDNYLNSPYYEKGRSRPPLRVGFNMIMAVKEDNVGILTQLIKTGEPR